MRSVFERLSRPEIDILLDNCNFSKEEEIIVKMANTGNSEIQIAEKMNLSVSCVAKKKRKIMDKIFNFLEVLEEVTTIYVDGKRVTKDELKNYEIRIESVKKILVDKLTERR